MANKKATEKVTDAQFKAADEIYEVAKRQSATEIEQLKEEIGLVRQEASLEGYLAKVEYDIAHNEFLRVMALYKMRQTKEYRKQGQTWEEFCDAHGYKRRTAEQLLSELKPLFDQFSANLAGFFGVSFNKIRLLGRSITAESAGFHDGCLVYDGQTIPIDADHKDEIEAVLDQIKDDAEKAKKDKALELKAKERVLADKEKAIQKLHKNLEKLEGAAREKGLTPAEDGFMKKIDFLRTGFDGYLLQLDPERVDELSRDAEPTPRMRAAYLAALDYMKKQILVAFDTATEMHGNAIMCPEAAWKPGMGAALEPVENKQSTSKK